MYPLDYVIVDNDKKEIIYMCKCPSSCFSYFFAFRKMGMNVSWFNITHPSTPDEYRPKG